MSFTAQRSAEIVAELHRIDAYLLALALEIDEATPAASHRGKTYQSAMDAAGQIFNLQERLREDQERSTEAAPGARKTLYGLPTGPAR